MIINWYTVIFTMINFLVLVFLLRRYLYSPIIRIMDERAALIAGRQEEATAKIAQAENEAETYRRKTAKLRQQEEKLLDEARKAAEAERKKLTETARQDLEATRRRWEDAFYRERETFTRELRREMGRQACLIARRSLRDLANADLEEMIWSVFAEKLQHLAPEDDEKLRAALSREERRATVRGVFPVVEEKLERLRHSLMERFQPGFQLHYETDSGLICGLELDVGGYRLGWNLDSYLDGVEVRILKDLEQGLKQEKEAAADE
ncbi:MAG: hypothetical protein AB1767_02640 [Bacillota bacterium]